MAVHDSCGPNPRSFEQRLNFYLTYLEDVVPDDVTITHVPNNLQPWELILPESPGAAAPVEREEIQLRYQGRIFMACILSLEHPISAETMAGHLAYVHWRNGYFVRDHHRAWRMFTALRDIRFCSSWDGNTWDRMATFDPIRNAGNVAAYLQRELDRVRLH